jgi:hypothetical protein
VIFNDERIASGERAEEEEEEEAEPTEPEREVDREAWAVEMGRESEPTATRNKKNIAPHNQTCTGGDVCDVGGRLSGVCLVLLGHEKFS